MKKATRLILGFSLLVASSYSFGEDNSDVNIYRDNDWRGTPWERPPVSSNRNRNTSNMPWSGDSNMPWSSDNPIWDKGTDFWRDWDTNKWGGNGMPWGGNQKSSMPWSGNDKSYMPWGGNSNKPWGGNTNLPWSKNNKSNKNRAYGRPYGYGAPNVYGNPYQGGYGATPYYQRPYNPGPYNPGQAVPPPPAYAPIPAQ